MPNKDHCSVPKCSNNRSKALNNLTFHQFPKDKALRRQWMVQIRRDTSETFSVSRQFSVEDLLEAAQKRIEELEKLLKKESLYRQLQGMSNKSVRFHTGFFSFEVLVSTFNALRPTAEKMYSWSQFQRVRNKGENEINKTGNAIRAFKLSLFDQFYLCVTKLRLGTFNEKLAREFNISESTVSRVFISWINFLYFVLGTSPIWPARSIIDKHMPKCFKSLYPTSRVIIDASEIKVQTPSSMVLNSGCYSSYKSHTTYKAMWSYHHKGKLFT